MLNVIELEGNLKTKKAKIAPNLLRYDRVLAELLRPCPWNAYCYETKYRKIEPSRRIGGLSLAYENPGLTIGQDNN